MIQQKKGATYMPMTINNENSETLHSQSDALIEANRAAIKAKAHAKAVDETPRPDQLKPAAMASAASAAVIGVGALAYPVHVARIARWVAAVAHVSVPYCNPTDDNEKIREAAKGFSKDTGFAKIAWPEVTAAFTAGFDAEVERRRAIGDITKGSQAGTEELKTMLGSLRRDVLTFIMSGKVTLEPDKNDEERSNAGKTALRSLYATWENFTVVSRGKLHEDLVKPYAELTERAAAVFAAYKIEAPDKGKKRDRR
jgi:hypothetical protein